jgi:hypothetical protein
MALESTQRVTEKSTKDLPGSKGRPARRAENLTAICETIFYKCGEPGRVTTLWAHTTCYIVSLAGPCYMHNVRHYTRWEVISF